MKSYSLAVMALLGYTSAVRFDSMYDPEYYAGLYTNVLVDVDAFKATHHRQHNNHGHHNKHRDEYDADPTTVSAYDAMENHKTWTNKERQDWFEEREKHLNQKIYDSFMQ